MERPNHCAALGAPLSINPFRRLANFRLRQDDVVQTLSKNLYSILVRVGYVAIVRGVITRRK